MYVPPSKRAGYTAPSASTLPPDHKPRFTPQDSRSESYTRYAISHHFTHPLDNTFTLFSIPLDPIIRPPRPAYDPSRTAETTPLPLSPIIAPSHPLAHLVSYISLFRNAHPDWESKGELWVHNRGEELMEDYGTDELPGKRRNFARPIPVFKESPLRKANFGFGGYYQIDKLRVVPPDSDELRELLHRKEAGKSYSSGGRSPAAWAESLSHQWIKLRLTKSPPSSKHYTALENPMKLQGGANGEVERYLLRIGGLEDELAILGEGTLDEKI